MMHYYDKWLHWYNGCEEKTEEISHDKYYCSCIQQ